MSRDVIIAAYRADGWGWLAELAGFDPLNTEAQAREAFQFVWDKVLTEETRNAVIFDVENKNDLA